MSRGCGLDRFEVNRFLLCVLERVHSSGPTAKACYEGRTTTSKQEYASHIRCSQDIKVKEKARATKNRPICFDYNMQVAAKLHHGHMCKRSTRLFSGRMLQGTRLPSSPQWRDAKASGATTAAWHSDEQSSHAVLLE